MGRLPRPSLFLTIFLSILQPALSVPNLVNLTYASYHGSVIDSLLGVSAWKGIQYAAPPIGNLRFAAPQPPIVSGIINATTHAPICPPSRPDDWTVAKPNARFTVSEDCLYLSVHAPSNATENSKLPVVVFFQGGGFTSMSSANWDPSEIVSVGQVVFVQFSYRVGMYGFLHSAAVKAGGGDVNAGIRDQIKVLEWVQEHIGKFGGDKNHVVLEGVSAGGSSTALMMAANLPKKLFAGAIMESGGWVTMRNLEQGEEQYQCLLKDKKCSTATDGLACLRALNESAIRSTNCWFNPNIDNELFADSYINLFEQGRYIKVPTIMGSCAEEGTKNAPNTLNSSAEALNWLHDKDPTLTDFSMRTLDKMYITNVSQPMFPGKGKYWRHTAVAAGEIANFCMTRNIQNSLARDGVPTYSYKYDVLDPADEASGLGAWHTVHIYSIWGLKRTDNQDPKSYFDANRPIIDVMRGYWLSFIHTLDPSTTRAEGSVAWVEWGGKDSRERLFIQTNNTHVEMMSTQQDLRCDIVGPFTNNLGKPPAKNVTTEFDSALVAKLNLTQGRR